jgi:hypothetical protein
MRFSAMLVIVSPCHLKNPLENLLHTTVTMLYDDASELLSDPGLASIWWTRVG